MGICRWNGGHICVCGNARPEKEMTSTESREDWFGCVEGPLRNLVRLLRNNGFNTYSSCGHLPPYVQMEWYEDEQITQLYNLLVENGYYNFKITAVWETHSPIQRSRHIELSFWVETLAQESDIRDK